MSVAPGAHVALAAPHRGRNGEHPRLGSGQTFEVGRPTFFSASAVVWASQKGAPRALNFSAPVGPGPALRPARPRETVLAAERRGAGPGREGSVGSAGPVCGRPAAAAPPTPPVHGRGEAHEVGGPDGVGGAERDVGRRGRTARPPAASEALARPRVGVAADGRRRGSARARTQGPRHVGVTCARRDVPSARARSWADPSPRALPHHPFPRTPGRLRTRPVSRLVI